MGGFQRGGSGFILGDYNFRFRGRLDPHAIVIDVGVGVGSLDDVASGDVDAVGLFDDVTLGVAEGAVALREEL